MWPTTCYLDVATSTETSNGHASLGGRHVLGRVSRSTSVPHGHHQFNFIDQVALVGPLEAMLDAAR